MEVERLSWKLLLRLIILSTLVRQGPLHGYAIYKSLESLFGGVRSFSLSLVYSLLNEMERDGLVESRDVEGRKVYNVTSYGLNHLMEVGGLVWRLLFGVGSAIYEGDVEARVKTGDYGGVLVAVADLNAIIERLKRFNERLLPEVG